MIKNVLLCNSTDEQLRKEMKGLALSLYDGSTLKIGEFLSLYRQAMASKGFEVPEISKLYNIFYFIKNQLEIEGMIKQIKQGVYYVSTSGVEDYSEDDGEAFDDCIENDPESIELGTHIIGEGSGEVYLYYFEGYKKLAELMNQECFRVKIGMTNIGCQRRFTAKTDLPEHRKIALVIKTDQPADLEKLLHSTLRLRGKQANDCPGSEWFYSNPAEVLEIYNTFVAHSA